MYIVMRIVHVLARKAHGPGKKGYCTMRICSQMFRLAKLTIHDASLAAELLVRSIAPRQVAKFGKIPYLEFGQVGFGAGIPLFGAGLRRRRGCCLQRWRGGLGRRRRRRSRATRCFFLRFQSLQMD